MKEIAAKQELLYKYKIYKASWKQKLESRYFMEQKRCLGTWSLKSIFAEF